MVGFRRLAVVAALAAALPAVPGTAGATPAPAGAHHPGAGSTIGASGVGDPFFPDAGNGGYDVQHYDLTLAYDPATKRLDGTARIRAVTTQRLSRFDLDLRKALSVQWVTVNGVPARFAQQGEQELVITPRHELRRHERITVAVRYGGVPQTVIDPDDSLDGWIPTDDGVFVAGEPQGAPSWFPANDHPSDKATFTTRVTVPAGLTVVGNGRLVRQVTAGGHSTFVWDEAFPMATYLATVTMGTFDVQRSRTPEGLPVYTAVDPREAAAANPVLATIPQVIAFEETLYGRYPFETVGAIVDHARFVGYALETQTKPVFDRAPRQTTLVHELAHQWVGDDVSLASFPNMWLNEGFATYTEWLWTEHTGGQTAQARFDQLYAVPAEETDFWDPPTAEIGDPANLFGTPVYDRGAMTLHALRVRIGDQAFFTALRSWVQRHRYGNVTTDEFTALAEHVSGQDLGHFFTVWLHTPGKPVNW